MKSFRRRRAVSDINMIPFIDIMLVMLVAFMVAAPMLIQGVDVNLPEVKSNFLSSSSSEPIVVSVTQKGLYYLNVEAVKNKPLSLSDLSHRVSSIVKEKPKTAVLIKGDSQVSYGVVVEAMSSLQEAGVNDVGLVTEPIKKR